MKRGAERQLTKDGHDDDDIEVSTLHVPVELARSCIQGNSRLCGLSKGRRGCPSQQTV